MVRSVSRALTKRGRVLVWGKRARLLWCVVFASAFFGGVVSVAQAAVSFISSGYSVGSLPSGWPQALAVGDLNGDGHVDVVVAENSSPGLVSVLLGDGKGVLGTASNVQTGADSAQDVAVGDFNGDGKQDLVVVHSNFGGPASVLLGNGDGSFKSAVTYS